MGFTPHMRHRLAAMLLVPLLLAGCGDGSDGGDGGGSSSEDDESSANAGLSEDEAAVRETLVASLLDPDCDLLTDEYLLDLTLFDATTVEEACEERQEFWQEPGYDEDDILITDIEVTGDTATAEVGSEHVNITTTYALKLVDGEWKVNCDEITCDDSMVPSPEVS